MTGKKGVFVFCKRNNNIALPGCTLHLVYISAEKGPDSLPISCSSTSERVHSDSTASVNSRQNLKLNNTRWWNICPPANLASEELKPREGPFQGRRKRTWEDGIRTEVVSDVLWLSWSHQRTVSTAPFTVSVAACTKSWCASSNQQPSSNTARQRCFVISTWHNCFDEVINFTDLFIYNIRSHILSLYVLICHWK